MWEAKFTCVKCLQELTYNEVMDSRGVCPKCGNVSDSTIVDHKKTSEKVFLGKLEPHDYRKIIGYPVNIYPEEKNNSMWKRFINWIKNV